MTTLHPFSTSRESVLPLWSAAAQARRILPDSRAPELFVLLHGMLFTNIQLDDFQPTLARLIERLQIEDMQERDWIMMAVVNVGSVLEYGKSAGILKSRGAIGARDPALTPSSMRVMAKRHAAEEEKMDVDDQRGGSDLKPGSNAAALQTSPSLPAAEPAAEVPASFNLALQLTFAMLTHVLHHPTRTTSPFANPTLNPYLTVLLTFITTVLRHPAALEILERSIPWEDLARFLDSVPPNVIATQLRSVPSQTQDLGERWAMLTSGCAPPLPEDWCLRGMEWVGRRVFERGYWKGVEERRPELEVLDKIEMVEATDGIIEDDGDDIPRVLSENSRRWIRIFRSAVGIAGVVKGFAWNEGTGKWAVEGVLLDKVKRWREEEKTKREEEERRQMRRRSSDDLMEVDEDENLEDVTDSEEDENDSDEIKALKVDYPFIFALKPTDFFRNK